ncbi:MAG TPA: hypothetical protein VK481_02855 [Gemmatimonadaceae bacterium]|nr:hypothetical protein [Gemmatimonadaceae bacterium]
MYTALTAATTFVTLDSPLAPVTFGLAVWIFLTYVVAPIRMRAKPGQLRAHFIPVNAKDADPGAWHFLGATATVLAREGFTPAPPGTPFTSTTSRTAVLQLFVHPTNGDVASVIAIGNKKTGGKVSVLGFSTEFTDSTSFFTGNSRLPSAMPERRGTSRCRFPEEQDPKRLYALHRARVKAAGKRQRPIQIEDSVAYQNKTEDIGWRWMVECGYHEVDGDRLRLTWKGAFLGIWRFLPPWRQLETMKDERLRTTLSSRLGWA